MYNVVVQMDIKSPIKTLLVLLHEKTKKDLSGYDVWLQNAKLVDPFETLIDHCVKSEGLIEVNVQIFENSKHINIVDVVMPVENVGGNNKNDNDSNGNSTRKTGKNTGKISLW